MAWCSELQFSPAECPSVHGGNAFASVWSGGGRIQHLLLWSTCVSRVLSVQKSRYGTRARPLPPPPSPLMEGGKKKANICVGFFGGKGSFLIYSFVFLKLLRSVVGKPIVTLGRAPGRETVSLA